MFFVCSCFFIEGKKYAIPIIIKPMNPKGGGIRNATNSPIPINAIPSFVHNGQPVVGQEALFCVEDFSPIDRDKLILFIIISVKNLSHISYKY